MSNIHIDTTTEKDAVRLTFSAPIESEVLTDALHTVLHLLRANCKMGTICTSQFNALVQTACDIEDRINKMLKDNTFPEITATIQTFAGNRIKTATVPCDESHGSSHAAKQSADAQSFRDSITEISRQILCTFLDTISEESLTSSARKTKSIISNISDCLIQRISHVAKPINNPLAEDIAVNTLWLLLQRHHAAEPIRNISALSMAIMFRIVSMLVKKNHDYGNSFGDQLAEDGPIVFKIRMKDKISRLRTLLTTEAQVKDESIEDTLRDIIGYCVLFLHHYDFLNTTR